jgi:tartrate dehydrogenase/decarboxylase/D-malate dehydrogenase
MKMSKYPIAAVPGDCFVEEVIAAGIEVMNALAERNGNFSFESESFVEARIITRSTES